MRKVSRRVASRQEGVARKAQNKPSLCIYGRCGADTRLPQVSLSLVTDVHFKLLLVVRIRLRYYLYMTEKNKAAQELGRLGGLKGGKERARRMTPKERSESARKAAKARWAKKRQQEKESEEPS